MCKPTLVIACAKAIAISFAFWLSVNVELKHYALSCLLKNYFSQGLAEAPRNCPVPAYIVEKGL